MISDRVGKILASLFLILLLLPGCITIQLPGDSNNPPMALIDDILPTQAAQGEAISFIGHGTDSDGMVVGYEWRSSLDGLISTIPTFQTSTLSLGTHTIYFRVLDNDNQWSADASQVITVSKKIARPVITLFTVSSDNIINGDAVQLHWRVTGAKKVTLDNGIGQVAANGSVTVYPATNTIYVLTASNEGGAVTATTSVNVQDLSASGFPVIDFTGEYLGGISFKLNWNVLNATQIVIEPDIGQVQAKGSKVVSVPAGQSITYRLTATNDQGWTYWQVIIASPSTP